jgi:ribosome maturation factor RimP
LNTSGTTADRRANRHGLGYDLVEIERAQGGTLRITIDWPWQPPTEGEAAVLQFITVEDCEKVTRQLQFALEVDGVDYKRLEVSSPASTGLCAMSRISSVSRAR